MESTSISGSLSSKVLITLALLTNCFLLVRIKSTMVRIKSIPFPCSFFYVLEEVVIQAHQEYVDASFTFTTQSYFPPAQSVQSCQWSACHMLWCVGAPESLGEVSKKHSYLSAGHLFSIEFLGPNTSFLADVNPRRLFGASLSYEERIGSQHVQLPLKSFPSHTQTTPGLVYFPA